MAVMGLAPLEVLMTAFVHGWNSNIVGRKITKLGKMLIVLQGFKLATQKLAVQDYA